MDLSPLPPESNGTGRLSADPLRPTADTTGTAADFRAAFGEDLDGVLDVHSWHAGADLTHEYVRIEREVREAIRSEDSHQGWIRRTAFPRLRDAKDAPPSAGEHEARLDLIEQIHSGLLFRGGVEACHGALQVHDTLPLTVYQIGVSLVSYSGDQGTWSQRLFRRDLRHESPDPEEDLLKLLESRSRRDSNEGGSGELIQRALLHYAERAILLRRSQAPWLLGPGNPVPYELLTGGGLLDLMVAGTNTVRELVEKRTKFLFVASEPRNRLWLSIGNALRPMEYFIVTTLDQQLNDWLEQERFKVGVTRTLDWDGEQISPAQWIPRFIQRVASRIVVGLFRASAIAPAQLFYAHVDHADLAAHIAIADARLQEHRGYPMLLEMARHVSSTVFSSTLQNLTDAAYAAAGAPWRYASRSSPGR